MKIKDVWSSFDSKYKTKIKLIKKGIFWIAIGEEAFFLSKYFNLKLTKLDKENIKVGFPDNSLKDWITRLQNLNIGIVLITKNKNEDEYKLLNLIEVKLFPKRNNQVFQ